MVLEMDEPRICNVGKIFTIEAVISRKLDKLELKETHNVRITSLLNFYIICSYARTISNKYLLDGESLRAFIFQKPNILKITISKVIAAQCKYSRDLSNFIRRTGMHKTRYVG